MEGIYWSILIHNHHVDVLAANAAKSLKTGSVALLLHQALSLDWKWVESAQD